MHGTERIFAKANVNEAAFPEGISLGALDPYAHGDGTEGESTVMSWALKWREEEKLDRLGTVNSDARRKPKYPKEQAAQNIT